MKTIIRLDKDKTLKIWSHKIKFPEFPGIEFAVHRYIFKTGEATGRFALSELSSGAHIWSGETPKKAIEASRAYLKEKGMKNIMEAIKQYINKYGLPL